MREKALLDFFGLREQPFGVTPDPKYLYLSPGHREALASLHYGLESNCGFLTLIAPPGMGKTTMLFHLLSKVESNARTAFLFQNRCTAREFMRLLLAELGIENDTQDFVQMHALFNRCLLQEARAGKHLILIVDEAQNLDPSVLEAIRLLSNFETPRFKLLQIILAGQPELADKLVRPSLSQLRQRITSVSGLSPLTARESSALISYRLQVAGHTGPELFSPKARNYIAEISEGIPRQVNKYCFHSLWLAYGAGKRTVEVEMVRTVAQRLDLSQFVSEVGTKRADGLLNKIESKGIASESADDSPLEKSAPPPSKSAELTSQGLTYEEAVSYMRTLTRRLHSQQKR